MARMADRDSAEKIVDVVLELLQSDGYDAVQLREVARRARVSLATVYKSFPTRDELIVSAIEHWMATNTYTELVAPTADEGLRDGLMRLIRYVFEPWERNPEMLAAFHRARSGPGGVRLDEQGFDAVLPLAAPLFDGLDPGYYADIELVLTNLTNALIGRFAERTLDITEILPSLERAVFRLTANNEVDATRARRPVRKGASRQV